MNAKLNKCSWIIHLFAVAHIISSWAMGKCGLNDEILLSLLTISMIVAVTQLYRLPLEVSAALAVLCCFAGYYLGTLGGKWLLQRNHNLCGYRNSGLGCRTNLCKAQIIRAL